MVFPERTNYFTLVLDKHFKATTELSHQTRNTEYNSGFTKVAFQVIASFSFVSSIAHLVLCYLSASGSDDQTLPLSQKPSSQIFYQEELRPSEGQKCVNRKAVH